MPTAEGILVMGTRNVVLTGYHEKIIDQLVKSGRYQNASEVIRDALRLIKQRDREETAKLKSLREAARLGFQAIDRGDFETFKSAGEIRSFLRGVAKKARSRPPK